MAVQSISSPPVVEPVGSSVSPDDEDPEPSTFVVEELVLAEVGLVDVDPVLGSVVGVSVVEPAVEEDEGPSVSVEAEPSSPHARASGKSAIRDQASDRFMAGTLRDQTLRGKSSPGLGGQG